jgi:hypothetical protein
VVASVSAATAAGFFAFSEALFFAAFFVVAMMRFPSAE